jgi:hypothetical protein
MSLWVFRMNVRARERWTWLILRFRSELRMRFIADFVFAKLFTPSVAHACGAGDIIAHTKAKVKRCDCLGFLRRGRLVLGRRGGGTGRWNLE